MRKHTFIWCLILIVMATMAAAGAAQEAATDSSLGTSAEQAIVDVNDVNNVKVVMKTGADAGVNPATDISADTTLRSVIFNKGASIKDALKFLAAKYHKNIVPSLKVEGAINVTSIDDVLTLHNVTFEEAMEAILGYGFKYDQDGDFVRVYTAEEYKTVKEDKSRMTQRVFTLYYVSAAEVKKLVTPVISSNGKVEATSPAKTGVPTGESISADSGGGDTMATHDTLIVYDYPENINRAEEVINSIDVRPKQVLIEATILSATLTEDMQLGIDWKTLKGTAITAISGITQNTPDYLSSTSTAQVTKAGGLLVGVAKDDVAAFIKAVEEVTDTTILANPKILAVNKQLGQVYIGTKVGYREGDTFDAQGNRVEGEVKFLDTGTKLSFRPYISNDGYIRMDIHPKDSTGSLGSNNIPSETSAELVTNILVKNGQTIVIGGLFRDKITNKKTQIPILGDIPILGAVFKGTSDQSERQEVIVLLTPRIIEEPAQLNSEARAEDIERKRFGAKNSIQWTGRARLAEDRYSKAVEYYLAGYKDSAMSELEAALTLRPTYLEAIRLKERIISETQPDGTATLERNMRSSVEQKDSEKWIRR